MRRPAAAGLLLWLLTVAAGALAKQPAPPERSAVALFAELCLGALADGEAVAERIARRFGAAAEPAPWPQPPPGIRATGAFRLRGPPEIVVHLAEPGGQCIVIAPSGSAAVFLAEAEALLRDLARHLPGFVRIAGPELRSMGEGPAARQLLRAHYLEASPRAARPRVLRVVASAEGGGPAVLSAETEEAAPVGR